MLATRTGAKGTVEYCDDQAGFLVHLLLHGGVVRMFTNCFTNMDGERQRGKLENTLKSFCLMSFSILLSII